MIFKRRHFFKLDCSSELFLCGFSIATRILSHIFHCLLVLSVLNLLQNVSLIFTKDNKLFWGCVTKSRGGKLETILTVSILNSSSASSSKVCLAARATEDEAGFVLAKNRRTNRYGLVAWLITRSKVETNEPNGLDEVQNFRSDKFMIGIDR